MVGAVHDEDISDKGQFRGWTTKNQLYFFINHDNNFS